MSDHYYLPDGTPFYEVEGKNGKLRSVNIRDAKAVGAVPSVTTVLNIAAKPGLINWMLDQAILAALTLPKREDESEADYLKRVKQDSKQQGRDAADEGSRIHDAVENWMKGNKIAPAYQTHAITVESAIRETFGEHKWVHEEPFAHSMGFGGKIDLYTRSELEPSNGIILDIKTKEFSPEDDVKGYPEHCIQLAAYAIGLGIPHARCANVFVSRTYPDQVRIIEWMPDEIDQAWEMFTHYLEIWKLTKGVKQ
jgi:hypothetical protein